MLKQACGAYVKNFVEHPEYCAKCYLAVCGAMGVAVGVATHYHDKCKALQEAYNLATFRANLWQTYSHIKGEED